jgi:hypothetical protein
MSRRAASRLLALTALLAAAAPAAVLAHHCTAMFDQSRTLTLEGVVKEFRWINPHAFIQVLVKTGSAVGEWSVETSTPRYLAQAAWTPGTLKAGDVVSPVIQPMRDGTRLGAYVSGAGPPGAFVNEPPTAPASTHKR